MNIFKLKLFRPVFAKSINFAKFKFFSNIEANITTTSTTTPSNTNNNSLTFQIKQLAVENDKERLRSFIMDNFFYNRDEINFYEIDLKSEEKFFEIISRSLPVLSLKEKIKINNKLTKNKKYFWPILSDILDEILKINESTLTKENLDIVNDALNSIKTFDKEILARGKKNIDRLFESFDKNFDSYSNIYKTYSYLFHSIFNKIIYIESILLHKKRFLDYENTTDFYHKIAKFILENFDNFCLSKFGIMLYDMDCAFYKNDQLNEKIIEMILSIDKEIPMQLKVKLYKDCLHTMTSNRIFEVIKREKSLRVIEIFVKSFIHQIRGDIVAEYDLFKLFQYSTYLHCILLHELKITRKSEIISKLEKIFDFFLEKIYQNICIEEKYKYENDYMNLQNAIMPLVYLISLNHKSTKMEEILKDLYKNKKIQEQNSDTKITFFHRDFLKVLIRLNIDYQVEDKENYISKDVVLEYKGKKVCIELDGKFHFYRDGTLQYDTVYKKHILENFGWKSINLNHSQWASMDDEQKLKYVKEILDKVIYE